MDWLATEILTGFQKLLCLGLERQPAAEVLPGAAMTWVEALTDGMHWEQGRDTDRIRKAFITLAATRRAWPAPADFREAMPHLSMPLMLDKKPQIPETREARMQRLDSLIPAELRGKDAAAEQGAQS